MAEPIEKEPIEIAPGVRKVSGSSEARLRGMPTVSELAEQKGLEVKPVTERKKFPGVSGYLVDAEGKRVYSYSTEDDTIKRL